MATTTNSTVNVVIIVDKSSTRPNLTADKLHLEVMKSNITTLVTAPSVVARVLNVSDGSITFSNVSLPEEGTYTLKAYVSDTADLDAGTPSLTRIYTGFIHKVANTTALYSRLI